MKTSYKLAFLGLWPYMRPDICSIAQLARGFPVKGRPLPTTPPKKEAAVIPKEDNCNSVTTDAQPQKKDNEEVAYPSKVANAAGIDPQIIISVANNNDESTWGSVGDAMEGLDEKFMDNNLRAFYDHEGDYGSKLSDKLDLNTDLTIVVANDDDDTTWGSVSDAMEEEGLSFMSSSISISSDLSSLCAEDDDDMENSDDETDRSSPADITPKASDFDWTPKAEKWNRRNKRIYKKRKAERRRRRELREQRRLARESSSEPGSVPKQTETTETQSSLTQLETDRPRKKRTHRSRRVAEIETETTPKASVYRPSYNVADGPPRNRTSGLGLGLGLGLGISTKQNSTSSPQSATVPLATDEGKVTKALTDAAASRGRSRAVKPITSKPVEIKFNVKVLESRGQIEQETRFTKAMRQQYPQWSPRSRKAVSRTPELSIVFEDEYESSTYEVETISTPWDTKNGLNALDVAGLCAPIVNLDDMPPFSYFWSEFEDVLEVLVWNYNSRDGAKQRSSLLF